jgi:hypothetical protein
MNAKPKRRNVLQMIGGAGVGMVLGTGVSIGTSPSAQANMVITRTFSGRATDLETGRWLYTEEHRHQMDGTRWVAGVIRYTDPQGALLAEKTLDFSQDCCIPIARTVYPPLKEEERVVAVSDSTVTMEWSRDGQRERKTVSRSTAMAVDSGFHAYLQRNFDGLMAGRTLAFQLGVPRQLDSFQFRVVPQGQRTVEGRTGLALRAEPNSLLRLVVPTLALVYDPETRDMLEYQGLSNIVDPSTRKALSVRIVYKY